MPSRRLSYRGPIVQALGEEATHSSGQLATSMVLRGAVGCVIGAAAAPKGKEGAWAAVGFAMGATVGEAGIVAVALAALWRKAG